MVKLFMLDFANRLTVCTMNTKESAQVAAQQLVGMGITTFTVIDGGRDSDNGKIIVQRAR